MNKNKFNLKNSNCRKPKVFIKKASDKNSNFDESVPAAGGDQNYDDGTSVSEGQTAATPKDGAYPDEPYPEEQYPEEGEYNQDPGASVAKSFFGNEVFQAAMSGDVNAQEMLARAAGYIASSTNGGQMGQQPIGSSGANLEPQQIMSPEEDLANEFVPPVENVPAANPNQQDPNQIPPKAQSGFGGQVKTSSLLAKLSLALKSK